MQQIIVEYKEKRITLSGEEFSHGLELHDLNKDVSMVHLFEKLGVEDDAKIAMRGFSFEDIDSIVELIDVGVFIPFDSYTNEHSCVLVFKNEKTELWLETYNAVGSALLKKANLAVIYFSKEYYKKIAA